MVNRTPIPGSNGISIAISDLNFISRQDHMSAAESVQGLITYCLSGSIGVDNFMAGANRLSSVCVLGQSIILEFTSKRVAQTSAVEVCGSSQDSRFRTQGQASVLEICGCFK
jgi:hypothetical protein